MQKISAVIIAKNEEDKISDCLRSVGWVEEILVIDSGSSDKTKYISKKLGAKVLEYNGGSYSEWRNYGLQKSRGDWIFYIDADERCSEGLRKEISEVIYGNGKIGAYAIPRENIILGKVMRHGGWWPDFVKRLYMRGVLKKWSGELHEEPEYTGELGHLKNPLIHQKQNTLSQMLEKTNSWSLVEAKLMYDAKHPKMNLIRFTTAIFREFNKRMFVEKAFLDGSEGIVYAIYQTYSRFISYAKLWELQNN